MRAMQLACCRRGSAIVEFAVAAPPNGGSYTQAQQLCANMKAASVIVYTVGFDVIDTSAAHDLMQQCATDASHVYLPSDGTELKQAFSDIAGSISRLRLSK